MRTIYDVLSFVYREEDPVDIIRVERTGLNVDKEYWKVTLYGGPVRVISVSTGSKIKLPQELELKLQNKYGVYTTLKVLQEERFPEVYYVLIVTSTGSRIRVHSEEDL